MHYNNAAQMNENLLQASIEPLLNYFDRHIPLVWANIVPFLKD